MVTGICVYYDHYAAAQNLTRHLNSKGHKHITCFAGLDSRLNSKLRQNGYIQSMLESNLIPHVINAPYEKTFGYANIKKLFSQSLPPPSAILCCSEIVAAGAIQACRDIDVHIPKQLEIVSFDSYDLCHLLTPIIPSSKFPIEEMSLTAITKLKTIMRGDATTDDMIFSPLPIQY
ncbi:hypothetical protein JI57_03290 [Psychromonas sp. PRT-SC03]|nr:hypothetical protein JI57_03290 [Psychromonas sp. PRT-SC03]